MGSLIDGQPRGPTEIYLGADVVGGANPILKEIVAAGSGPIGKDEVLYGYNHGVPVTYIRSEAKYPEVNGKYGSLDEWAMTHRAASDNGISFTIEHSSFAAFDEVLMNAIQDGHLERAEQLLDHAPANKPLAHSTDSSGVLAALFSQLELQSNNAAFSRVSMMVRKAINLGADPTRVIIFEDGHRDGFEINAVELILNEWATMERQSDAKALSRLKAARAMFDIFFEMRAFRPNMQVLFAFSATNTRKFGIIHWLLLRQSSAEMRQYFLSHGVGEESVDDGDWNMAMMAAATGNIDALKEMREICGSATAASLFNYRCPTRFNPTVLHASITGLAGDVPAERVIEIINFLVANGANPEQKSIGNDLIGEVDFWAARTPQRKADFRLVRSYLERHQGRLVQDYQACLRALGG